eukprot:4526053-Prymnesium_polylepis.1
MSWSPDPGRIAVIINLLPKVQAPILVIRGLADQLLIIHHQRAFGLHTIPVRWASIGHESQLGSTQFSLPRRFHDSPPPVSCVALYPSQRVHRKVAGVPGDERVQCSAS